MEKIVYTCFLINPYFRTAKALGINLFKSVIFCHYYHSPKSISKS